MPSGVPFVLVEDTTRALGRLAAWHRARFDIPVVAVTGSNGKTTTKELIAAVLATRWAVLKPPGSFNNQWGLPLTLLSLGLEHEALVVEIGANQPGEIAYLAGLAAPTAAAVTTVAQVHTEFFGSLDGVREEKVALVRAVGPSGVVALNADDQRVAGMLYATFTKAPAIGARAVSANLEHVRTLPGVKSAFILAQHGDPITFDLGGAPASLSGVAILADSTWHAMQAKKALQVQWDESGASHDSWTGAVAEALQTARVGRTVGQVLEGQMAFPLVVRYAMNDSTGLESVGTTKIQTPDRRQIPLSTVATIQEDRGPNFVMRENVQRRIVVQSNVSGRDLRSVVNDIRARVGQNVRMPQGYRVEYGGQFENQRSASRLIVALFFVTLFGMFLLLYKMFASANLALQVMAALPMAFIGSVAALYVTGQTLSADGGHWMLG